MKKIWTLTISDYENYGTDTIVFDSLDKAKEYLKNDFESAIEENGADEDEYSIEDDGMYAEMQTCDGCWLRYEIKEWDINNVEC